MTTTILVTDAEQRAALAAVRALGRAGYRIIVCSSSPRPLAAASRHAAVAAVVPDPLRAPSAFVAAVAAVCQRYNVNVLLPIAEPSILAVLRDRPSFEPAIIPFPSYAQFVTLADKAELMRRAPASGVAVPRQVQIERLPMGAVTDVAFPLVVKPSRTVAGSGDDQVKLSVTHVSDPGELADVLRLLPPAAYPVLLQERIVGPGLGIFLLRWHGKTLAAMVHRRIREKPPSGGVSVLRETIPAPPGLVEQSERLLEAYDWSGVAMVEYKLDAATGTYYLMEVNGRLWGSLQLAIDAGVNFPLLMVKAALGEPIVPVTRYHSVMSRWWWGEVDHLLARWVRREPTDGALPGRLATTLDVLRPWRSRCREEVFRWDDPKPFFRETRDWFRALAR